MSRFQFGYMAIIALTLALAPSTNDQAMAGGGSWGSRGFGSSGGSWGSSGGSSGGFGSSGGYYGGRVYRTPVRNMLGRIRDRFHARLSSRGHWGCSGGYASSGGYGCSGGYVSHGSWGSSGGFASSGGSSGGSSGIVYTAPVVSTVAPCDGCGVCDVCAASGIAAPMVDPAGSYYNAPQGIQPQGQPTPSPANNSFEVPPQPSPQPDNGDTRNAIPHSDAILTVAVPESAKVWINGKPTSTPGDLRNFVSRKLQPGKNYRFKVRAVVVKDGREVALSREVELRAGAKEKVEFDFDKPQLTQVTLNVPEDAVVTLSGQPTSAVGTVRHFKSRTLKPGESWNDYRIEVSVVRNGRTVRAERTLDIEAGGQYDLTFTLDETQDLYVLK